MMVCIDLVNRRRMAPADSLFAQPVQGVFAHCGIEAWPA
jgi:hypothetical protein